MVKRIIALVTVIVLVLMNFVFAFADNVETIEDSQATSSNFIFEDVHQSYDPVADARMAEFLIEKGETVAATTNPNARSYWISMTHYYQHGETWSSDIMQTAGATIHNAGCCLTSFAMVQRYLDGTLNPGGVNTMLGNAACPFYWDTAASIFGYEIVAYSRTDTYGGTAMNWIVGALDTYRCPVIVGMYNGDRTHFVVANKYTTASNVVTDIGILDPDRYTDYTWLQEYFDDGWRINRLYVYSD